MLLWGNSTITGDAAKETNHRSPRPRSAARAMAGLLARGSTTDANLPGCPVIIGGVVLPLTVAGAATASAFRPAPCSLLIPERNHQEHGYRIAIPATTAQSNGRNPRCGHLEPDPKQIVGLDAETLRRGRTIAHAVSPIRRATRRRSPVRGIPRVRSRPT
jgi:hypothetical protein